MENVRSQFRVARILGGARSGTMWVSNLLLQEHASQGHIQTACKDLVSSLQKTITPTIFFSSEVGSGIVPNIPLSREFRGQVGWLLGG